MKFNNKWDMLPDKEVNNRAREGRFSLYRREGDSSQVGAFGEVAYVERGRRAQGKRKGREAEERESRGWIRDEAHGSMVSREVVISA